MGRRRPERTARRKAERSARELVRERERLAALLPGGSEERPIEVPSSSVIPGRARSHPCPLCEGSLRLDEETAPSATVRAAHVTCTRCGARRQLWFTIRMPQPN